MNVDDDARLLLLLLLMMVIMLMINVKVKVAHMIYCHLQYWTAALYNLGSGS